MLRQLLWHDVRLEGRRLIETVGALSGLLRHQGVRAGDVVRLQVDDTGRAVLALLALANLRACVVLDEVGMRSREDVLPSDSTGWTVSTNRCSGSTDRRLLDVSREVRALQHCAPDLGLARLVEPVDLQGWFAQDRALGLRTSGTTTGRPVMVWKTGHELVENSLATARLVGYSESDLFLPLLPLSHQYGVSVAIMATVLGAGMVTCSRTRVREALRTVARHSVTAIDAPPRLYRAILEELTRDAAMKLCTTSVRRWGVGGSLLSGALQDAFTQVVGRPLIDGYGSTQLGNVAFTDPTDPEGGLRPVDTYQLRVLPAGAGLGEIGGGEVVIRRTDRRRLDGLAPVPGVDGDWHMTGDIGRASQGRIFVHGRAGSISRNGHTLHLASLQARLHPLGVPVELIEIRNCQGFWAVVEDPLHRSAARWRLRLEEVLDDHELPDHVEVLGALPSTLSGKADRSALVTLVSELRRGRSLERGGPTSIVARDDPAPHERVRRLLGAARSQSAALIDAASTVSERGAAEEEHANLIRALENALGELSLHHPANPCQVAVYMPSNTVLEAYALYCLLPALWSPTVLVRPARGTTPALERIHAIFSAVDALPIHVHDVSQPVFTAEVARTPGAVVFCGRRRNAEKVLRELGREQLFIFFGKGYNPVVVTEDADLRHAAREVVQARLHNGGQDCLAPDVVLAQSSIEPEFVRLVTEAIETELVRWPGGSIHIRDPRVLSRTLDYLIRNGDHLHYGGDADCRAGALQPAILRWRIEGYGPVQEHFAPVLNVVAYDDLGQATALLRSQTYSDNALGLTTYGLAEDDAMLLSGRYCVVSERSLFGATASFEPFGGGGVESGFSEYRGRRRLGPGLISALVSGLRPVAERTPHRVLITRELVEAASPALPSAKSVS